MTHHAPRISVITPVLNGAPTIARCLDSVAAGARPDGPVIEHVVVDGGSTDGTRQVLAARESAFLRVIDAPARGIADAFNRGIAAAQGDWIGIINADDWYAHGALARVAGQIAELKGDEAVIHGAMMLHNPQTGNSRVSGPLDGPPSRLDPWRQMPAQHPTVFVPRAVYGRLGAFNPAFRLAMDYEFLLRCHMAGLTFRYIPAVIAHFSRDGASLQAPGRARAEEAAARILHSGTFWPHVWARLRQDIRSVERQWRRALLRRPKV